MRGEVPPRALITEGMQLGTEICRLVLLSQAVGKSNKPHAAAGMNLTDGQRKSYLIDLCLLAHKRIQQLFSFFMAFKGDFWSGFCINRFRCDQLSGK